MITKPLMINTMANIQISPDKNTVTSDNKVHKFNRRGNCNTCSLFKECCERKETVANKFPFACVSENRTDGKYGNFQSE